MSNYSPLHLFGVQSSIARLELTFMFSSLKTPLVKENVRRIVTIFVKAGKHGAYPASGSTTEQSRLEIVSELLSENIFFTLQSSYVDANSFQLIRNMAGKLENDKTVLKRILVKEIRPGELKQLKIPIPNDLNEDKVYPALSDQLTFDIDWVNTQFSMQRRCLVEFQSFPEPFLIDEITKYTKMWGNILEAGGFAMPVGLPDEVDSIMGSVSQFDEVTIEIEVARFQASEAGWNVLINLLDSCARRNGIRIKKLMVE